MKVGTPVFYSARIRREHNRLKELETQVNMTPQDFKKVANIMSQWLDFLLITDHAEEDVRRRYLDHLWRKHQFKRTVLLKATNEVERFFNLLIMYIFGVENAFNDLCTFFTISSDGMYAVL